MYTDRTHDMDYCFVFISDNKGSKSSPLSCVIVFFQVGDITRRHKRFPAATVSLEIHKF